MERSAVRRRVLLRGTAAAATAGAALPASATDRPIDAPATPPIRPDAQLLGAPPGAPWVVTSLADGIEEARGRTSVIRFEGRRCIHVRACVLGEPGVFIGNISGPWINPDAASPADVQHVIRNCASGALTMTRLDGGPAEAAPKVNTIRLRENGPLALHAEMLLDGVPNGYRATLCRCGQSANKPYCDGSHKAAGFVATGEPETRHSTPLALRDGQVNVAPQPDGPLLVSGPVEIVSGTGRTVDRVTDAALCRCGQSKDKPFCDGSHLAAGFKAP